MTVFRSRRVQWFIAVCIPILAIFVAFIPVYTAPFIWDDHLFVGQWELIRDFRNIPQFFAGALPAEHIGDYRPLHVLLQSVMYHLYAVNSVPYHIHAVITHVLTSIVLFLSILILLRIFSVSRHRLLFASFGATLFGLHPVVVEPVAFVTASFDTAGILFAVSAYYCFLRAIRNKRLLWIGVSTGFSIISFLFYEMTYTLPILILVTATLVYTREKFSVRAVLRAVSFSVPSSVALACILFVRFGLLQLRLDPTYIDPGIFYRFLAMTRAMLVYMYQLLLPIHLAAIHEIAPGIVTLQVFPGAFQKLSLLDGNVILSLFLMASAVYVAWIGRKTHPLISLGIIWVYVGLLPVMSILAPGPIYSERYLYLSVMGYVLVIIGLIDLLFRKVTNDTVRTGVMAVLWIVPVLYGMRTFFRTIDWANPILFWSKEASAFPNVGLVHKSLGNEYQFRGKLPEALDAYTKGIEQMPEDSGLYYNTSMVLFDMQRFNESIVYAEKAAKMDPSIPQYKKHVEYLQKFRANSSP